MDRVTTDLGRFAIVPLWLLDLDVSDRAVRLYATLAAVWADRETGECWPSRSTLAGRLGCSVDSVDRATRELTDVGALAVEPRSSDSGQTSNLYRVRSARPRRVGAAPPGREGAAPQPRRRGPNYNQELESEGRKDSRQAPSALDTEPRSTRATKLCAYFVKQLVKADPGTKTPTIGKAWVDEAERLFRIDCRDPGEVRRLVDWIFTDPEGSFWIANCRSIPTFRKRYDQMRAQMIGRGRGRAAPARPVGRSELTEGVLAVGPKGRA